MAARLGKLQGLEIVFAGQGFVKRLVGGQSVVGDRENQVYRALLASLGADGEAL